jgi:hypothetical protein
MDQMANYRAPAQSPKLAVVNIPAASIQAINVGVANYRAPEWPASVLRHSSCDPQL